MINESQIKDLRDIICNKLRTMPKVRSASYKAAGKLGLSGIIDHTILKPDAVPEQIKKLCEEAVEHGFASVCINPANVKLAADLLKNSNVKVCTVIGFPLGASTTAVKAFETKDAVMNGADEVDMVINVASLKAGDFETVKNDIEAVVSAAAGHALVKVIIETCLLTVEEIIEACIIADIAGADFVKTSTGFCTGGARVEDIRLMRAVVGYNMGVKASGGIRDYETAAAMVEAGADRLGTSASIAIIKAERL